MLVAESRMVMGKAHVFHVGSLSNIAIILSMVTAIGALWKFHKQQELAITLTLPDKLFLS